MQIKNLLWKGHEQLRKQKEEKEKGKRGTLRGGNSGAIIEGDIYGKCPRISLLRKHGIDIPKEPNRELMFQAGETSELSVVAVLQALGYTVKAQEEVGTTWQTTDGTPVTGSPDVVFYRNAGQQRALELKLVSSMWTAYNLLAKDKPSSDHIIQAAHYSLHTPNTPYYLTYVSRSDYHVGLYKWMDGALRGSTDVEWKDGKAFKMLPFYKTYMLHWQKNGKLALISDVGRHYTTKITRQSIEAYYERIQEIERTQQLGARPTNKHVVDELDSYSPCDYCPLKLVCDEHEDDYDVWQDAVKLEVKKMKKQGLV